MVDEHFLREPFEDPFVLESLKRGHTIHGVPVEALVNKVEELRV